MTRGDLTARLKLLGVRRDEFAEMLGVTTATTYHWAMVPKYVDVIVGLLEELKKLRERIRGK